MDGAVTGLRSQRRHRARTGCFATSSSIELSGDQGVSMERGGSGGVYAFSR